MLYSSGMRNGYSSQVHRVQPGFFNPKGEFMPSGAAYWVDGVPVPNPSSPPPTAGHWRVDAKAKATVVRGVGTAKPTSGRGMPRTQQGIQSPNTKRAINARKRRAAKAAAATPTRTANTVRNPNVHSACARPLPGSVF